MRDPNSVQEIISVFDPSFNQALLTQFLAAGANISNKQDDASALKRTHFFHGRYENVYLNDSDAPNLIALKADARKHATSILTRPIQKMGC